MVLDNFLFLSMEPSLFLAKSFSVFGFLGDEVSESSQSILSLLCI